MGNSLNLLNKMKWLAESKALEKSEAKTLTQSASPVSSHLSHICWLLMRARDVLVPSLSVMNPTITSRSTDSSEGTLLPTVRNRTVFTAEPKNLENFTIPSSEHKLFSHKERFYYLLYLAETVYDVNNPQRVCVSMAHTLVGYWPACLVAGMCCCFSLILYVNVW